MEDYGGELHKTFSCLPSPKGSVAATQHPIKEIRESRPRKFVTRTRYSNQGNRTAPAPHIIRRKKENTKTDPMPGARGSLPTGFLLLLSHHSRRCHRPFLLFLITVPVLLHRRRRPSHVGGPQEVEHRGAASLIRQEVPHSPLPLPLPCLLFDPCPQLGLLVLPPRAVLKEVVARLLHTTVVLRGTTSSGRPVGCLRSSSTHP